MDTKTSIQQGQRAFSLIEAAIVLGITGLVLGGIWVGAAAVSDNRKVSVMLGDTALITSRLEHLYQSNPPTSKADITAVAISAGVIPAHLVSGNNIRTPFNTGMTIETATDATYINYGSGLYGKACRKFFPALFSAIARTQEFMIGRRHLVINGHEVNLGDSTTTIMSYCAESAGGATSYTVVSWSDDVAFKPETPISLPPDEM